MKFGSARTANGDAWGMNVETIKTGPELSDDWKDDRQRI
jgi:hypothetical protein